jgi:uracil phosphoribosyltransferase
MLYCAVGISSIHESYPEVRIVTGEIDTGLNQQVSGGINVCYPSTYLPKLSTWQAYIVPGLGDYGDRYYGTTTN